MDCTQLQLCSEELKLPPRPSHHGPPDSRSECILILTASLGDETLLFHLRWKIGKLIVKVYFGCSVKEFESLFFKTTWKPNLICLSNKYLIFSDAFQGHHLVVDLAVSALQWDSVMLKVLQKEMILNPQSSPGDGPEHPQPKHSLIPCTQSCTSPRAWGVLGCQVRLTEGTTPAKAQLGRVNPLIHISWAAAHTVLCSEGTFICCCHKPSHKPGLPL